MTAGAYFPRWLAGLAWITVILTAGAVMAEELVRSFPADFASRLATAKEIYVATQRKDGTRSAVVPVWFAVMDNAIWFTTSPDSHKVKRVKRGSPLFVHPAGLGVCSPLVRDFQLTWVCGAPFEDTMFALHIIRRQIPQRYPKIKIIVPHLGGALPVLFTRIDTTKPMFAAQNAELPSATMKRLWYDTVAQNNTAGLKCAVAHFGADRLVYGSDYPYQLHAEYLNSVKYVQESGLPKADIDKILDHTAARLLGLER